MTTSRERKDKRLSIAIKLDTLYRKQGKHEAYVLLYNKFSLAHLKYLLALEVEALSY